jgi:hypothetical protein
MNDMPQVLRDNGLVTQQDRLYMHMICGDGVRTLWYVENPIKHVVIIADELGNQYAIYTARDQNSNNGVILTPPLENKVRVNIWYIPE